MQLCDLPPELRELALLRSKEEGRNTDLFKETTWVSSMFGWSSTAEGNAFWRGVNEGIYHSKLK